jgi:hypothetical protein
VLPRRRPLPTATEALKARDRQVAQANRWAAGQPRSDRSATRQALDAWAESINADCDGCGAPVLRIGQRLHSPAGLRLH